MPWRINPTTGERVWVADNDQNTIAATIDPNETSLAPPTMAPTTPSAAVPRPATPAPTPAPETPLMGGGMNPLRGIIAAFDNNDVGADAGQIAGATRPPLDFGEPELPESYQQYFDSMEGLISGLGANSTPPPAPQLPAAPTYEADPGLGRLAEHAETRNTQVSALLEDLRGDLEAEDPQARNRWMRMGEWLSMVAADGRLENAGAIMSDILTRDRAMSRELRREALALTLQGYQFEDAMVQAQANLLTGQHQAAQQTEEASYNRDVAQTGIDTQYEMAGWEASQRSSQATANLMAQLFGETREAQSGAREEHRGAIAGFLDNPDYGEQAAQALIPEGIPEETGGVLARSLARDAELRQLAVRAGIDRNDLRDLGRQLRRLDPNITDEEINRVAVMLRSQSAE